VFHNSYKGDKAIGDRNNPERMEVESDVQIWRS